MKKRISAMILSAAMAVSSIPLSHFSAFAESTELFNDTFESGFSGWAARGDSAVIEIVNTASHSGTKSLYVTGRTVNWNGAACAKIKELRAGQTYDLSAWVMYDDENGNAQEQFNLQMLYKDASGDECYKYIANTQASKGSWSQIKGTVTIPEDATGVTIYIESPNATLNFYIDDIIGIGEPAPEGETTEGFFDDFTDSTMLWSGRGDAVCTVAEGEGVDGGDCLFTEGRSKLWNGPSCNKTLVMNPGGFYKMSGWVKYTGEEWSDTQTLTMNMQFQQNGKECYVEVGRVTAVKGEWAYIEANYTIPADAANFVVYFQTAYKPDAQVVEQDLMDFYIDDVKAEPLPAPEAQMDIPSLKDVYSDYFILGGSCSKADLDVQAARDIIVKHYDSITFGNNLKPDYTLDQTASQKLYEETGDDTNPQVNIDQARAQIEFCVENDIPIRGHVLVWHSQTPDWFFKEGFSDDGELVTPEVMNQRLENYIKNLMETLAAEYPDANFYAWDVVNEAFSEAGEMRVAGSNTEKSGQSMWVKVYGDDSFINKAFEYARKYAPEGCKLFYNDYNEYAPAKRDAIIEKCAEIKAEGNIDGIGMQSHIGMSNPSLELYEEAFRKYNELGLEIHVTELDIDQKSNTEESMLQLAKRYQDVFRLYKKLVDEGVNITAVVTWGITDSNSWIGGYPNLFDELYQAKDAFYAVVDTATDVKLIQTANAVKYDAAASNGYSDAFEYQKQNTVGNGWFKIAYDGQDFNVRVYNPNDEAVSIAVDPELNADISTPLPNEPVDSDYIDYVITPAEGNLSSIKFDIQIGDAVWNGYDFDNETGTMGTVNVVDMPKIAEAVYGIPEIDGTIDDAWTDCTPIDAATYTLGSNGATGTSRMMWDENYIYVLTEVKDPVLSKESSNAYEQDTVEVFFDENNGKTQSYEADDIQCRVNYDNEKTVTDGKSIDDFISATSLTDDGYIVEMAIPYTISPFKNNQVVGFDVQVNDDNGAGERTGIANWSDLTGLGYTNTSGYGVLKLTGGTDVPLEIWGDADSSGGLTISDAVKIMSYVTNSDLNPLTDDQLAVADVYQHGDGISNMDALAVQKRLAQLLS
ncbi:MAG: endo-1,4-beta-xylanase, partial [Ruminococcus sp.]|nr:endo-1,4-beta-xylanase [Ruminococcus sp.]